MSDDNEFEGRTITERKIAITKAGDGLSDALLVDDYDLAIGDEVTIVLRGTVASAKVAPADKKDLGGDLVRTDTIQATSAKIVTLADGSALNKELTKHEREVAEAKEKRKEEAEGIKRIPFDEADDQAQADEDGVAPDNVVPIDKEASGS